MAQAYATFANGGYSVRPYIIDSIGSADGEIVYRADPAVVCRRCEVDEDALPESRLLSLRALSTAQADLLPGADAPRPMTMEQMVEAGDSYRPDATALPEFFADVHLAPRVISEQNAYLIQDMMRDVITRGTGRRALQLGRTDLSGKTGTSNDQRDAWFAGFNSRMSVISWVGYDLSQPLGPGEQGSKTALPLWIDFMRLALEGTPPAAMPMPDGIVTVRINKSTGCPASASDSREEVMFEIFRVGQVPECEFTDDHRDIFNEGDDPDEPIF
jgi:penicillin-binding protein 1A